jgi:hypothetical protein
MFARDDDIKGIMQVREAKRYGYLQPRQIVNWGTHLEYVFDGMHPVKALEQGIFCIRCRNAQPDEPERAAELHRRLTDFTGYRLPDGKKPTDCCCYCGAVLTGKAA